MGKVHSGQNIYVVDTKQHQIVILWSWQFASWLSKQNALVGGAIDFKTDNKWGVSITTIS